MNLSVLEFTACPKKIMLEFSNLIMINILNTLSMNIYTYHFHTAWLSLSIWLCLENYLNSWIPFLYLFLSSSHLIIIFNLPFKVKLSINVDIASPIEIAEYSSVYAGRDKKCKCWCHSIVNFDVESFRIESN